MWLSQSAPRKNGSAQNVALRVLLEKANRFFLSLNNANFQIDIFVSFSLVFVNVYSQDVYLDRQIKFKGDSINGVYVEYHE